jgi:hypothetical protein
MRFWTKTISDNKKPSIACSINFYDNYEKVLIFVLEMGEM